VERTIGGIPRFPTVRKLDIPFANAGTGAIGPLGKITEEAFDKQFDVNVTGLLLTVQKALLLFQDGGSIVLKASIASITGKSRIGIGHTHPARPSSTTDEIAKAVSFLASDDALREWNRATRRRWIRSDMSRCRNTSPKDGISSVSSILYASKMECLAT
jgi:NAD(P)-dependent dehydrogenase (short-subunit alcohol dehydrogenase family)